MYKSNIFTQKEEMIIYPPNKPYNLLSPSYNSKLKTRAYFNTNINNNYPKFRPLNLYSSCFSPFQNGKNLSVKNINSPDDKVSQNLLNKLSGNQKGTNSKTIGSPNTTNSDLLTAASLTSQQSNESFLSNNNNVYIPTSFQPYNLDRNEFNIGNRYNYSMIKPNTNFCNNSKNNNNIFINGNYSNINLNCYKGKQGFITQNHNVKIELNKKDDITNFNSNNSANSNSSNSCKKSSSNNSSNSNNNKIKKGKINNNQRKKYFNKFNSSKENSTNDNTVILTLKIKVAKNDIRIFNLKKYDDLFISLEKFFDLNQIEQSLVKPIVNKIFAALNKIFWLWNNKIGKYDAKYLNSLYKLWIKNKETLPKKNKNNNSSISSSDSSDENNKHKKIGSNSFHEGNNLSEDEKDEKQKTSKSI